MKTVCALYAQALELHQEGIHVVSVDQKTGIQSLERIAPTQQMQPGLVERLQLRNAGCGTSYEEDVFVQMKHMSVVTGWGADAKNIKRIPRRSASGFA